MSRTTRQGIKGNGISSDTIAAVVRVQSLWRGYILRRRMASTLFTSRSEYASICLAADLVGSTNAVFNVQAAPSTARTARQERLLHLISQRAALAQELNSLESELQARRDLIIKDTYMAPAIHRNDSPTIIKSLHS
ncbi:hypothetical protein BASA50_003909 [Batrachochytrium salamandrivorans]|uniref:Uncharacterized protein n=1 Tax=Batrachochytrium salamandrivorans TaxID=1357716 RepID=A0ABQ8FK80_9FUNG|nr:hypothetical protein BASA60_008629 [Batrachochytrium salamandrivorans]KAH6574589.1 hypothetical protein BASA62_002388 [Batrachochytrium salamandrivorans]KAH6598295.1 hypothetical protein BASA50_003909 [Batrachochytrium salamandrivorans]KAH6602966.1 hypothetical protein BASA61_000592 [Batrachochytrium salamandrivorans]KAH9265915.1 hypothetical protein BASA84_001375 [Batrachochytrium salamandrivorans]